jgi:hypothetical protein
MRNVVLLEIGKMPLYSSAGDALDMRTNKISHALFKVE